jgi:hypothetical protein
MKVYTPAANIIFIEKRRSCLASLGNAMRFLISQSDLQCFSHEDECFAPAPKRKSSLIVLLQFLKRNSRDVRL